MLNTQLLNMIKTSTKNNRSEIIAKSGANNCKQIQIHTVQQNYHKQNFDKTQAFIPYHKDIKIANKILLMGIKYSYSKNINEN